MRRLDVQNCGSGRIQRNGLFLAGILEGCLRKLEHWYTAWVAVRDPGCSMIGNAGATFISLTEPACLLSKEEINKVVDGFISDFYPRRIEVLNLQVFIEGLHNKCSAMRVSISCNQGGICRWFWLPFLPSKKWKDAMKAFELLILGSGLWILTKGCRFWCHLEIYLPNDNIFRTSGWFFKDVPMA